MDEAESTIAAATAELVETVREAGFTSLGRPWRTLALETQERDRRVPDGAGPSWIVKVAVTASAPGALPADLLVQAEEPRDELSIFMPGATPWPSTAR